MNDYEIESLWANAQMVFFIVGCIMAYLKVFELASISWLAIFVVGFLPLIFLVFFSVLVWLLAAVLMLVLRKLDD